MPEMIARFVQQALEQFSQYSSVAVCVGSIGVVAFAVSMTVGRAWIRETGDNARRTWFKPQPAGGLYAAEESEIEQAMRRARGQR